MAHYAYKHCCYDIDYEKYRELVARFEKEQGCEHDGDSNYDGDNWYIAAMWIEELREQVAKQAAVIEQMREALKAGFKACETNYNLTQAKWVIKEALTLQPCPEALNKVRADAVLEQTRVELAAAQLDVKKYADLLRICRLSNLSKDLDAAIDSAMKEVGHE